MTTTTPKPTTAKQAVVEVLRLAAEPLKSAEIARSVLEMQGVRPAGMTPAATVDATVAVEHRKPNGLFMRTAPGTYTLRERSDR